MFGLSSIHLEVTGYLLLRIELLIRISLLLFGQQNGNFDVTNSVLLSQTDQPESNSYHTGMRQKCDGIIGISQT